MSYAARPPLRCISDCLTVQRWVSAINCVKEEGGKFRSPSRSLAAAFLHFSKVPSRPSPPPSSLRPRSYLNCDTRPRGRLQISVSFNFWTFPVRISVQLLENGRKASLSAFGRKIWHLEMLSGVPKGQCRADISAKIHFFYKKYLSVSGQNPFG